MTKLHVIVASHNREAITVRALRSLRVATAQADVDFDVTLFDDGSSDGTIAGASGVVEQLNVLRGDGSAFWAKSMATAEQKVLTRTDVQPGDWLMWFNDDVELTPSGLRDLLHSSETLAPGVIVGSTIDPTSGELTYGGLRRSGLHPLAFDLVAPPSVTEEAIRVNAFNGNVVLMPVHVARSVGPIDGGFSHAFADVDYGMRASSSGVPVWVTGGAVGLCSRNPAVAHPSLAAAWRAYVGKKGAGNPRSLLRYLRRHQPRSWWFFFASSYALWWVRNLRGVLSAGRAVR
jgi:GT2 family glycosyltransferase